MFLRHRVESIFGPIIFADNNVRQTVVVDIPDYQLAKWDPTNALLQ